MNCRKLQPLREPTSYDMNLKGIKPLTSIPKQPRRENYLNNVELLAHFADVNLYTMRILRDEIVVRNKSQKLEILLQEIRKFNSLLNSENMMMDSDYTQKSIKEFKKRVGQKPEHTDISNCR